MRVGFVKQLLWERYGQVWITLVKGVDSDILEPDRDNVKHHFEAQPDSSGLCFRLAIAEALALSEADILIVPDLNPGETIARGGGQDPWIARFPEALQRVAGLPPVIKVPASLEVTLEPLVLETLLSFKRDPNKVRLVWERVHPELKPKRYPEPRWNKLPGQKETASVIGQPWLITEQLLRLVPLPDTHVISQQQFSPASLREEAKRLEKPLIATDAEVLGAAHFLNRKGNIDKIVMIVDSTSGSDLWLEKQVRKIVTKPLEVIYLQGLLAEHGVGALLVSS
jgi:hypothetical protein